MRWLLALLLLAAGVRCQKNAVHAPVPVEADSCPPNTFTCRDGACIPTDWVGDGEPDCDDHSDEEGTIPFPNATTHKGGESVTPVFLQPFNATDPFEEEQTAEPEDCPTSHLERVDACSQPTFDLLSEVQAIDFNASSILPRAVSLLSKGCSLTTEFDLCIQGSSPKCQPEPSIPAWKSAETFFCQLLVPTVHEHSVCFGGPRSPRCVVSISQATSTMCRLIGSIVADMECLEKIGTPTCSEDAMAMLGPMREESTIVAKEQGCVLPTLQVISEGEAAARMAATSTEKADKPDEEFSEDDEETNEAGQQGETPEPQEYEEDSNEGGFPETTDALNETTMETVKPTPKETPKTTLSSTTTTTTTTTPSTTTQPKTTPTTQITQGPRTVPMQTDPVSISTSRRPEPVRQAHQPTPTHAPVHRPLPVSPEAVSNAPKPPLGNAMRAMQAIGKVCSAPYTGSPWAPVHSVICSYSAQIEAQAACFGRVSSKGKCGAEATVPSPCAAIEAFNAHLDCAIDIMNEECDVAAQDLIVEIQEKANDRLIELKCFDADSDGQEFTAEEREEKEEAARKAEEAKGGFVLRPQMPHCSDEQENGALACLVELVEVNKQLVQLQNLNFLLEIAKDNSTVVESICSLYGKYEACLEASVFSISKDKKRCAFASPLNSLARIGLSPICGPKTRELLSSHQDCLSRIANEGQASTCQSALASLGYTVQAMIQGAHGEALLCKSFYLIRDTFECGKASVEKNCDPSAVEDLLSLRDAMTALGVEEGCPATPPANLEEILRRPVTRPPVPTPRIVKPIGPPPPLVPASVQETSPHASGPQPVQVQPVMNAACDQKAQALFQECVAPLTEYQPHPLIVIRQPRLIDEACKKFTAFQRCTENVACRPVWSRGMTAMFEFACTEALDQYKEIRGCIRKLAAEDTVRECVGTFSKGAPQQACLSANNLLACALPAISASCGDTATNFAQKYVAKFAHAIDPRCRLAQEIPIGRVLGIGCSIEEEAVIEHCAAPLNDIATRLDEMFQGGLQSLIKNANALAPVFAGGCSLTSEFQVCAAGVLTSRSPCVVSSCMIKAGEDICHALDPVAAIDANLSCVFSQVQEPTFAKCIRSTLSTIKQFSLAAFKAMLPKFVSCVEEIVLVKCGPTPIKILKAISSPDVCPMGALTGQRIVPIAPVKTAPQTPVCDAEKKASYRTCGTPFYSKYRMLPIALLTNADNMDEFCSALDKMDECSLSTRICASKEELALKDLGRHLCSIRSTFDQHKICLKTAAEAPEARSCISEYHTAGAGEKCAALTSASKCMAEQIRRSCSDQAMQYAFSAMAKYAGNAYDKCEISIPSVSLSTECSEADLIVYLTCETHIDSFSPRPIAILADPAQLSDMCTTVETKYRPCLEKMPCKFEPATTANLKLYEALCEEQVTRRDHARVGKCLGEYVNSTKGSECLRKFTPLDLLNNENRGMVCGAMNGMLSCAAADIESQCGYDALLHIVSLYSDYAQHFDAHCSVKAPEGLATSAPPAVHHHHHDHHPTTVVKPDVKEVEVEDTPVPTPAREPTPEPTPEPTTAAPSTTSKTRDVRLRTDAGSSLQSIFILPVVFAIARLLL